jgi:D-Tyr-tRNAtyr deacylase
MKGITTQIVEQATKDIAMSKIYREYKGDGSAASASKSTSVLEADCDVLVVPQACLSGKLKGKTLQHHNQVEKETGYQMWVHFLSTLGAHLYSKTTNTTLDLVNQRPPIINEDAVLRNWSSEIENFSIENINGFHLQSQTGHQKIFAFGTYGNRQGLNLNTDGPFTLIFDW